MKLLAIDELLCGFTPQPNKLQIYEDFLNIRFFFIFSFKYFVNFPLELCIYENNDIYFSVRTANIKSLFKEKSTFTNSPTYAMKKLND